MNPWWITSVAINRALCGDRTEPLCSRVYRQNPSHWRSAFMRCMNALFRETHHCETIHARWIETQGIHCRETTSDRGPGISSA